MKELIYHRMFLPGIKQFARTTAVIDGEYRATCEQHLDRTLRIGHALRHRLGIDPGDRFAVMATNSHQYLELYHAAFLGNGVINPLNLRLAGKELDYIVRDSGTEVVFADQYFAPLIHQALGAAGGDSPIRHTVLIGEGEGPCDLRYEELIEGGEPVVPEEPEEHDPVVLMYTGGTTGLPKGVLVSQRAEILNVYHVSMRFDRMGEGEVSLMQTPMFHAASIVGVLGTIPSGGLWS